MSEFNVMGRLSEILTDDQRSRLGLVSKRQRLAEDHERFVDGVLRWDDN